jgi:hypothetical protein
VRNSLNRWILGSNGLGNDPDVFFLRNQKCRLSESQKKLIYTVNHLTGKLVFTSDNPDEWTDAQKKQYEKFFPHQAATLLDMRFEKDVFEVKYQYKDKTYFMYVNTGSKKQRKILPETLLDESSRQVNQGSPLIISKYAVRIFTYL